MKNILLLILFFSLNLYSQEKYAFLVGISDYGNEKEAPYKWTNINGTNDVRLLKPLLEKQGFRTITLMDSKATYSAIIKEMNKLTLKCKKGDYVYIHFSCHGQPFEDQNGDEDDGWDESIVPVDAGMIYKKGLYEGENHIIDDDLLVMMSKIRSKVGNTGVIYVVLDACHAGTSFRGDEEDVVRGTNYGFSVEGKRYRPTRIEKKNHYQMKSISGYAPIIYLEACRPYQKNVEIVEKGVNYGGLSYYISRILSNHKLDRDYKWIYNVDSLMKNDIRLSNQNMVIEISQ